MRRWASDGEYPPAKRQLLWGTGVVVVVFAAVGLFALWVWFSSPHGIYRVGGTPTAAQSDLQNALTGAETYQDSDGTFTGLMTGSNGVSSIQEIGTGLTWTTGASKAPHIISAHVGGNGSYVVLVALADTLSPQCYGILYLPTRQHSPVFARSGAGTYFFVGHSGMTCDAATVRPAAMAVDGFPSS
ncbi:MAG: hypothetical protein ABSB54_19550 [Acidimicrobiales bacterium]|jgi:hypothetical protein